MQVQEIMTRNPACCTPDSTLQEVAQMMEQNDCGCIPVVNSLSEMKPVGTITDRDITIRTVAASDNPVGMTASEVMTTGVATVLPQMSVEECFDVMEDREIRRVLVVDEQGRCCGIVAQADVVQSGASPVRTNRVVREISESAPSPHRSGIGYRDNTWPDSGNQSFLKRGTLIPLLIGLGAGTALTLLLNNRKIMPRRNSTQNLGSFRSGEERMLETANNEPIGIYPNAEEEIEKRRQHLEDRVQSVVSGMDSPNRETGSSAGESVADTKGRGPAQG